MTLFIILLSFMVLVRFQYQNYVSFTKWVRECFLFLLLDVLLNNWNSLIVLCNSWANYLTLEFSLWQHFQVLFQLLLMAIWLLKFLKNFFSINFGMLDFLRTFLAHQSFHIYCHWVVHFPFIIFLIVTSILFICLSFGFFVHCLLIFLISLPEVG